MLATKAPAQKPLPAPSSSVVLFPISAILLTLLGAFLASLKSIAAAQLQRKPRSDDSLPTGSGPGSNLGIGLGPLELIYHISPLALLQALLLAWLHGEFHHLSLLFYASSSSYLASTFSPPARSTRSEGEGNTNPTTNLFHTFSPQLPSFLPLLLLLNVLTALLLNIVSLDANRRVGPLGITIAGNVKQVLLIVVMGGLVGQGEGEVRMGSTGKQELRWWRWIGVGGVLATFGGSIWWGLEEGKRKRRRRTDR